MSLAIVYLHWIFPFFRFLTSSHLFDLSSLFVALLLACRWIISWGDALLHKLTFSVINKKKRPWNLSGVAQSDTLSFHAGNRWSEACHNTAADRCCSGQQCCCTQYLSVCLDLSLPVHTAHLKSIKRIPTHFSTSAEKLCSYFKTILPHQKEMM